MDAPTAAFDLALVARRIFARTMRGTAVRRRLNGP